MARVKISRTFSEAQLSDKQGALRCQRRSFSASASLPNDAARNVSIPRTARQSQLTVRSKPRTARSARALAKREPQVHEHGKRVLFLRSTSSSSLANDASGDLYALRKPHALRFAKKNAIHPFEDASSLEFFAQKNDTSLLCFASHSKKRPHCLTFARTFAGKMLDMLECTITPESARSMRQFGARTVRSGLKPLLAFSGLPFEEAEAEVEGSSRFKMAKSLFTDFFRGEDAREIDVEGLQCLITFAAAEEPVDGAEPRQMVYMRVWKLITKRSGQKLPRVELEEIGPRLDFKLGRVQVAEKTLMKEAMKQARGANVSFIWDDDSQGKRLLTMSYSRARRRTSRPTLWVTRRVASMLAART